MNHPARIALLLVTSVAIACAQPTKGPPNVDAEDTSWQNVTKLLTPGNAKPTAANPSDDRVKSLLDQEIDRRQQLAQGAQSHRAAFLAGARAAEAKKLEGDVRRVEPALGAADPGGRFRTAGNAFRQDKSNPAADRFDVALALESLALPRSALPAATAAAKEAMVENLYTEFGGIAQVYNQYLSLIRTADSANAVRIAGKLNQRNLPDEVKQEVWRVLDRSLRVGKPVELAMAALDGSKVDLAALSGTTGVFFWNTWAGTDELALPAGFRGSVPAGVRWVYVGLGGIAPTLAAANAKAAFGGHLPGGDEQRLRHHVVESGDPHGQRPGADHHKRDRRRGSAGSGPSGCPCGWAAAARPRTDPVQVPDTSDTPASKRPIAAGGAAPSPRA